MGEVTGNGKVVFGWLPQPICGTSVVQQGFFDSFVKFVTMDGSPQGRQLFGGYAVTNAGGYIPQARDKCCEMFLESEHEYLLFLDWDITYKPEDVYILLDSCDPVKAPIVGGVYVTFMGQSPVVLRPCFNIATEEQEFKAAAGFTLDAMNEATAIGMGFTMIHRSVLEAMRVAFKDDPWHYFGHDIIQGQRVGEDTTFASRARSLGFPIYANGSVRLGHTKAKEFVPEDMLDTQFMHHQPPESFSKRLLNIGGGSKQIPIPPEYRGATHLLLDIAPGPDVDIEMDARTLKDDTTIPNEMFDVVYMSHVIEHFYSHDVAKVLEGAWRVLKPGGILDIRTPDMGEVFAALATHDIDDVAYESAGGSIMFKDILYGWGKEIESSGQDHYAHKTGFTEARLKKILSPFNDVKVTRRLGEFELSAIATKGDWT